MASGYFSDAIPAIHPPSGNMTADCLCGLAPLRRRRKRAILAQEGAPVILNTSFNIAGQPIIETPEEAINTFWDRHRFS